MKTNLALILGCALLVWGIALGAAGYQNHRDAQALASQK